MSTRKICLLATLLAPAFAQQQGQPIYRVTVVQRSTPAINYNHRSEPTKIDFKGTPLLPEAHGVATVENRRGATMVDARFNDMPPPSRFGSQYLTYVVWSISPEGRAQAIGELILNGSEKGHLVASTPMQAFALIVTAEPYYSVTQPSDAVVMENAIRPETVGDVRPVNATYELLPRKEYTYNVDAQPAVPMGPGVSAQEYEAIVASYQAKNALQIAIAAGADRYAADKLNRAQALFEQTKQLPRKTLGEEVVAKMREAAQIAEDARAISVRRAEEEHMAQERMQNEQAQKRAAAERAADEAAAERARLEAQQAQQEAQRANQRAEQEVARAQAEAEQTRIQAEARQNSHAQADRIIPRQTDNTREVRVALRQSLSNSGFQTLDTPRGLVVLIPNSWVESAPGAVRGRFASLAATVSAYRSLKIQVESHTDGGNWESSIRFTEQLAAHIRDMLVAQGIPAGSITSTGYGGSRPTASNQTAVGRQQNRRTEIVISGDPIGSLPVWEQTYSLERKPLRR